MMEFNDDEKMWVEHATNLRARAAEYENMVVLSQRKRELQRERRDKRAEEDTSRSSGGNSDS